jgi:hypothetical protein
MLSFSALKSDPEKFLVMFDDIGDGRRRAMVQIGRMSRQSPQSRNPGSVDV